MNGLTWQKNDLVIFMEMMMTQNTKSIALDTANSSLLPEPEPNTDKPSTDNRNIQDTKWAQVKRIFGSTWMRLLLVIAVITGVILTFVLINTLLKESTYFGFRGETSTIKVDPEKNGRESLNASQAEYLMERRRQEARAKSQSGESSAAVLELPKEAAVAPEVAETLANKEGQGQPAILQQNTENSEHLDLTNNQRYKKIGNYYIDQKTNQVIVPPEQAAKNAQLQRAKQQAQLAEDNPNAAYNTQQQGTGQNGGQNSGQNGGQNNGQNQNGGQNGTQSTDPNSQQQEPQPDSDLPIIQQSLYDNYEEQLQEQAQWEQAFEQQRQQNLERARQIAQQRRQVAQSTVNNQVQSIERRITSNSSGYSSQLYYPSPSQNNQTPPNQTQPANPNSETYLPSENLQPSSPALNPQNPANSSTPSNNTPSSSAASNNTTSNNATSNTGTFQPISYPSMTNGVDNFNAYSSNKAQKQFLPQNIIRAGTSWPVVVVKSVNTDEGLLVIGQIMEGPFSGSEVYGSVQQTGRDIGVIFTRILPPNPRLPIVPVSAIALTLGSQKQAVSSKKNNHYLQNYSVMAAESIIAGYGEAYANQNETVIQNSNGTIITSRGKTTRKEVTANILSEFADRLNNDIAKLGNRPPTYYIRQGSVLTMKLTRNMDINATSGDLASQGNRSSL